MDDTEHLHESMRAMAVDIKDLRAENERLRKLLGAWAGNNIDQDVLRETYKVLRDDEVK